jgi:hypothetical protein
MTWFGPSSLSVEHQAEIRKSLDQILERKSFHLVVIGLIVIEVLIGIVEMILALYYDTSCPRIEATHSMQIFREILPWISYVIICFFVVETIIKLWVYRIRLFRHVGNIVDLVVISISFALDTVSRVKADLESREQEFATLLLILRFWRILRIVHGVAEEMKIEFHEKYHKLKKEIEELKIKLQEKEA